MIDLFVSPGDEIIIKFAVAIDENNKLYVDFNKKSLSTVFTGKESEIETYEVIFKKPSFQDTIEMAEGTYGANADGQISFNILGDRYQKMVHLLKSWTLKDKDGKILPPNKESVQKLHPSVAEIISTQLEAEVNLNIT